MGEGLRSTPSPSLPWGTGPTVLLSRPRSPPSETSNKNLVAAGLLVRPTIGASWTRRTSAPPWSRRRGRRLTGPASRPRLGPDRSPGREVAGWPRRRPDLPTSEIPGDRPSSYPVYVPGVTERSRRIPKRSGSWGVHTNILVPLSEQGRSVWKW